MTRSIEVRLGLKPWYRWIGARCRISITYSCHGCYTPLYYRIITFDLWTGNNLVGLFHLWPEGQAAHDFSLKCMKSQNDYQFDLIKMSVFLFMSYLIS